MGRRLVAQMIPALEKISWSGSEEVNSAGRQAFDHGRDTVDAYRGDPKTLAEALRILQTASSLPYAYAGVAYTLIAASQQADGNYDPAGLAAALEWLEKAQALAPDITDVNVIETLIYIHGGRYDDARLVLDYLHERDPYSYYLCRAEIAFWQSQGDLEKAILWSEEAIEQAETVPQRLRVRNILADLYMEAGRNEDALQSYKEAIHFYPENGWLWHKASLIFWQQEEFDEAKRYNAKALELEPQLEAAQKMREALEEREKSSANTGILGRFFGS